MPGKKQRRIEKSQRIKQALIAANNGMSLRQAATQFECSKSVLHFHIQKRKEASKVLTKNEEERLGNWIVHCHYMGYCLHGDFFRFIARDAERLLQARGLYRKLNSEWYRHVQQRLPSVKKCLILYENYKYLKNGLSNKWLGSLVIYCKNVNLIHCLEDPRYMYYCCQLDIIEGLQMVIAYTAHCKTAPPLLINAESYQRKEFEDLTLPQDWLKYNCDAYPNFINKDKPFEYYVEEILKPHLLEQGIDKPILLFTRSQDYPPRLQFYEYCVEHDIYPANASAPTFKFNQALQTEISFRIKSARDLSLAKCVDLMKNIITSKLADEKLRQSFRESLVHPLAVANLNYKSLPTLEMSLKVDRGNTCQQLVHIIHKMDTSEESVLSDDNWLSDAARGNTGQQQDRIDLNMDSSDEESMLSDGNDLSDTAASSSIKREVKKANVAQLPQIRSSSTSLNVGRMVSFNSFIDEY